MCIRQHLKEDIFDVGSAFPVKGPEIPQPPFAHRFPIYTVGMGLGGAAEEHSFILLSAPFSSSACLPSTPDSYARPPPEVPGEGTSPISGAHPSRKAEIYVRDAPLRA